MVSSHLDGALLLKWRGVAARHHGLGLQHLLLTDLPPALRPESPHTCRCNIGALVAEERGASGLLGLARGSSLGGW